MPITSAYAWRLRQPIESDPSSNLRAACRCAADLGSRLKPIIPNLLGQILPPLDRVRRATRNISAAPLASGG